MKYKKKNVNYLFNVTSDNYSGHMVTFDKLRPLRASSFLLNMSNTLAAASAAGNPSSGKYCRGVKIMYYLSIQNEEIKTRAKCATEGKMHAVRLYQRLMQNVHCKGHFGKQRSE
jgi:hypothetical protein